MDSLENLQKGWGRIAKNFKNENLEFKQSFLQKYTFMKLENSLLKYIINKTNRYMKANKDPLSLSHRTREPSLIKITF